MTTFPFEHSTPNHEQGSISAPLPSQFDNAPKGSLTTLSRNLNSAKPVHSYNSLSLFFVQFKSLPETLRTCKGKVYVYIYIYIPSLLRDEEKPRCWRNSNKTTMNTAVLKLQWCPILHPSSIPNSSFGIFLLPTIFIFVFSAVLY